MRKILIFLRGIRKDPLRTSSQKLFLGTYISTIVFGILYYMRWYNYHALSLQHTYIGYDIFLTSRESAVFSCPNDCCSLGEVSRYISVHVAGASEAATINGDWSCYSCGVPLIEDVSCRTLAGQSSLVSLY